MVDISGKPYYDLYDPKNKYTQILAVPGRVGQAREYTSSQTMIYDMLKRLSNTLLRDGNIVEGMGFTFTDRDTILVEDGKVYMGGKILLFEEQEIPITKQGHEVIGVKLEEELVTDAAFLNDPATGSVNYGKPGAHRIKSNLSLTLNDDSAPAIYEFVDGKLKVEVSRPEYDALNDLLAQRTHDESGNYRVSGLQLVVEPYDADNVQLTVEAGTAYILGYQITKPTPVKKLLPISREVDTVLNEPKVYQTGTDLYELNNYPASEITEVVAEVQTQDTITRGSVVGGIDYLPETPVVEIVSVTQGGTTYTQGIDYQLTDDGIDWSLSGAEPAVGTTYTAVWRYNKVLVEGTDYQKTYVTGNFGETKDYVEFLSGDRPVDGSTFTLDYSFFLAREDLISMDRFGNILVTQGQSDRPNLVQPPFINNEDVLQLGTSYFPPNSADVQPKFASITRLEMGQLQRLQQRVDDIEYNQAVSHLDDEAMKGEPPTDLKGIFTDNFHDVLRGDLTNPEFTAAYSLEDGLIMLPPSGSKVESPAINLSQSNAKIWGRIVSSPLTEIVSVEQQYATQTKLINPYLAFNTLAQLSLDPEVDSWVEQDHITIRKMDTETRKFWRWWGHPGRKAWLQDLFNNAIIIDGGPSLENWRPSWSNRDEFQNRVVTTLEKSRKVLESSKTYMRQIEVNLHCENLVPSADNLQCLFDDRSVTLTPTGDTQAGSNAGTVRADSNGVVDAKFTIPSGVRTGTREVVLQNDNNIATASFTSIGTQRTVKDTVLRKYITLTPVDPVAQTFQFDQDTILTSVGVYFAAKNATDNVTVQIRDVVNGYPGTTIYAQKVLTPSDIVASEDATDETKITFDDPIHCEAQTQYAVCYVSDSAEDSLWIADLGDKDVTTGQLVQKQPYLAGLLFTSSNGLAWTAQQSQNLKFKIYTARFEPTGTIQFDPITNVNSSVLLLLSDYLTPKNTGCFWEMSIDDQEYRPIASYEELPLNQIADKVELRATFKSSENMSPLLALDSFTLVGFLTETTGSYISRNVVLDQNYTNVKIIFDGDIPKGSTITPKFSYDDGQTWQTPPLDHSEPISIDFTRYFYEMPVADSENATEYRVRLDIEANTPVLRPRAMRLMNIMK